jgi:hypothetical protein
MAAISCHPNGSFQQTKSSQSSTKTMKIITTTIAALFTAAASPAMALTPPVCFNCSLQESMRQSNQYFEMQRIEQRQQEQQQQLERLERQQRWNRYHSF